MSQEEAATHKNILAIRDHSQRTREIVRELETTIKDYENLTKTLSGQVAVLQAQLAAVQVRLFTGGATK